MTEEQAWNELQLLAATDEMIRLEFVLNVTGATLNGFETCVKEFRYFDPGFIDITRPTCVELLTAVRDKMFGAKCE